ncbi:NAD(P)/FAD-dependent oxidoreductase [Nesterenkonia sp. NBAIMH1]|uniref:flavin-containing monooxygenase n=1 Tax=Nesterenkonia sp. NBAIMH1 TaxID=2600320 RepID=UPI0011B3F953|nr:NAD(P)/FAD-dependent oxidoreductase [Nesterenkonia sp. NBAIMH1]
MTGLDGTHVRVLVVGAGFAGLGAAIRMRRSGEDSFLVLEQADEVGGTWRDNTYPGVACDVPSHLYSFSFAPKSDWKRRFAGGEEIRQYLRSCAEEVAEHIRCGTRLLSAEWRQGPRSWKVTTNAGTITAGALVLASGRFSRPALPTLPGLVTFPGRVCHTARWDPRIVPEGARIGVVGSGASAVQAVPALVGRGAQVTVFQRSAPWILPKHDAAYGTAEQSVFAADDDVRRDHRAEIFDELDSAFEARVLGSTAHTELRRRAQDHLRRSIPAGPVREALTPADEVGCRRVLLSDDFYPAVASGAAAVEPSAPLAVQGRAVRAASGRTYELDALVFATGFDASRPAIASSIVGRGGETLAEHWADGMTSYGSTSVSGFPNCIILGGPHAALGHNSAVAMLEAQFDQLLSALASVPAGGVWEVRAEAEKAYTAMIDERAASTAWVSPGCRSWYRHGGTGRVTLLWPGTAQEYRRRFGVFHPEQHTIEQVALGSSC